MKIALLRVAIDSGSGGMQGPLFEDGSFEYVPIPDWENFDKRKYGNTRGKQGRLLVEYFRPTRQERMARQSIHFDPEFITFTYGDPTAPKTKLRCLTSGYLLVFYCGLEGWDLESSPALYLLGYFEVSQAGLATDLGEDTVEQNFSENFHVLHRQIYSRQKERLVLVKGGRGSRLLERATCISSIGTDCRGQPIKVLSPSMRKVFGGFGGRVCIQRSPPRWVDEPFISKASEFVRSLD